MSEAEVSDSTALNASMRGHSKLIVVLGDSQTFKDSARKLGTLVNIIRVARGVFLIHGQKGKDQSILEDLPMLSFQKAREIPSVSDRGKEANSRRVYAVVSYRFKSPTAIQKKRVERLVRRSVSIRLRPGVLLFPVLRSKDRRRLFESDETGKFLDSKKTSEELRSLGADVSRWSRLRLVEDQSKVKDALAGTLLQDTTSFEELVKDLRARAKDPEAQYKTLRKRYSTLSRRYRKMKIKWSLASRIWSYDATKMLTRSYNMLIATRRTIESSAENARER